MSPARRARQIAPVLSDAGAVDLDAIFTKLAVEHVNAMVLVSVRTIVADEAFTTPLSIGLATATEPDEEHRHKKQCSMTHGLILTGLKSIRQPRPDDLPSHPISLGLLSH